MPFSPCSLPAGKSETQTKASDPLQFYKGYLAVLAKAKSLDELLPYYTRELGEGLRKMPAEMQANYIRMNARALTDLKVTKQQVDSSKAVFEMSAKTADGRRDDRISDPRQGGRCLEGRRRELGCAAPEN